MNLNNRKTLHIIRIINKMKQVEGNLKKIVL